MNEINKQLQNIVPKKQELVNENIIKFDREEFKNLSNEVVEYLETSAFDILNISAKSQLQLGRKFQEIFDTLGKQGVEEGVYTKYVLFLGYSDRTVLRYRNRWKLYNLIENKNTKGIIAIMPVVYVDKLLKEYDSYKEILEEDITLEELRNKLDNKKQVIELKHEEITIPHGFFKDKIFNLSLKAEEIEDKLTEAEKIKVSKALEVLEKILNK
jgi:hypothetical protein